MSSKFTSMASAIALLAALAASEATAQQNLPTINIGQRQRATSMASSKPRQSAVPVMRSDSAPVTSNTVSGVSGESTSNFVPAGQQIERGPTGVNGYFAAGTSTALKMQTKLLDLPQSVSIVTRQQLDDRNSLSLGQALSYVPGVNVAQGEGQRDQITIRGQNTTADFYLDNVRDDAEYYRDLYNIQAVEVLKGPSAVTFGRGGAGGVVNRVTKKADGIRTRNLEFSTGSFGRKRVTLDVGDKINDQLAYRINGLYEQSYSYRNYFNLERWGINPTITWKPTEKTFISAQYEHFRDRRVVDRGVPSVNLLRQLPTSNNGWQTYNNFTSRGAGFLFPAYPIPTNNWTFFGNPDDSHSSINIDRGVIFVDHTFDNEVNVKNQTVYANYDKYYQNAYPIGDVNFNNGNQPYLGGASNARATCPGLQGQSATPFTGSAAPCVPIGGYSAYTPRQNIFNQMDFTYKFKMFPEVEHNLVAGWEVGNQKSTANRNDARFGNPSFGAAARVNAFLYQPTVFNPVFYDQPLFRRYTDLNLAAGYAMDQIKITKYVDVLAGVRLDSFNLRYINNLGSVSSLNQSTNTGSGLLTLNSRDYWGQEILNSTNRVSPRLGVVLKPIDKLSLYVAYSRSFLPGGSGADQFTNLTFSTRGLQPQGFMNMEGGFKYEINPALMLTGALFNLTRTNQAVAENAFYSTLIDSETNGAELALTGKVTEEWETSIGYSNQRPYVTSSGNLLGNFLEARRSGATPQIATNGRIVPFVPFNMFNAWNKYDVSNLINQNKGTFALAAGVIYNTQQYAELNNAVIVPGYVRVDGAAFFKVSEKISGQVNIENILGANYYVSAHNNNNITPGSPRAAYVTLNAKF
jgi:catecholate siderophore receptor